MHWSETSGMHSLALYTLPTEILYDIQYFALSSSLPLTCKHLYSVYKSAPPSVHAEYLIGRYLLRSERLSIASLVSTALRYPLCGQAVLEAILRSPDCPPCNAQNKKPPTELPRRLFRSLSPRNPPARPGKGKREEDVDNGWAEDDEPLPFLRYLYDHPHIPPPCANSYDGYALTRAVHAGFVPLVRFLLDHGASPACKDGLAVMVAIRKKDLSLVRMLVERDGRQRAEKRMRMDRHEMSKGAEDARVRRLDWRQENKNEKFRSSKRRKLEDRVEVNQAMLKIAVKCDARSIVEYLMQEKGCIPDMQTVLMMGTSA